MNQEEMFAQRRDRLVGLIQEANDLVDLAIEKYIHNEGKMLAGIAVLYSGGNDSTTLAHLFRNRADYAIHVNTGIGIEQTRQFVRDTCAGWNLELLEEHPPPGSTYEELVIDQGFPGPGHHFKMYQRLKERGLRKARKKIVQQPRRERVLFLAGRRRDESQRRMNIPEMEREGSTVWVSPLVNWTKEDLNTYRKMCGDSFGVDTRSVYGSIDPEPVPRNAVSDCLHMSGECLCGAFAHAGELDEIAFWYPETAQHIRDLEEKVRAAGHPEKRCKWGWGGGTSGGEKPSKSGPMCTSCDARFTLDTPTSEPA